MGLALFFISIYSSSSPLRGALREGECLFFTAFLVLFLTNRQTDGQTENRTDRRTDGWTDGQNGWISRQTEMNRRTNQLMTGCVHCTPSSGLKAQL